MNAFKLEAGCIGQSKLPVVRCGVGFQMGLDSVSAWTISVITVSGVVGLNLGLDPLSSVGLVTPEAWTSLLLTPFGP